MDINELKQNLNFKEAINKPTKENIEMLIWEIDPLSEIKLSVGVLLFKRYIKSQNDNELAAFLANINKLRKEDKQLPKQLDINKIIPPEELLTKLKEYSDEWQEIRNGNDFESTQRKNFLSKEINKIKQKLNMKKIGLFKDYMTKKVSNDELFEADKSMMYLILGDYQKTGTSAWEIINGSKPEIFLEDKNCFLGGNGSPVFSRSTGSKNDREYGVGRGGFKTGFDLYLSILKKISGKDLRPITISEYYINNGRTYFRICFSESAIPKTAEMEQKVQTMTGGFLDAIPGV